MINHHYAGYADHKKEHQKILDDICVIKQQVEKHIAEKRDGTIIQLAGSDVDDAVSESNPSKVDDVEKKLDAELVVLLRSWIMDHVLSTDQKLKPLFIEKP